MFESLGTEKVLGMFNGGFLRFVLCVWTSAQAVHCRATPLRTGRPALPCGGGLLHPESFGSLNVWRTKPARRSQRPRAAPPLGRPRPLPCSPKLAGAVTRWSEEAAARARRNSESRAQGPGSRKAKRARAGSQTQARTCKPVYSGRLANPSAAYSARASPAAQPQALHLPLRVPPRLPSC